MTAIDPAVSAVAADVIEQVLGLFGLPLQAMTGARIPKTVLTANADLTAADRRFLKAEVEGVVLQAVIGPGKSGVPAYARDGRDYAEIHFVSARFDAAAKPAGITRFVEVLHRAIPNPVLIVTAQGDIAALSVAPKHLSKTDVSKATLDYVATTGNLLTSSVPHGWLTFDNQSTLDLNALYDSWCRRILTFDFAARTNQRAQQLEALAASGDEAHRLLHRYRELSQQLDQLRRAVKTENQMARRIEINGQIQSVRRELDALLDPDSQSALGARRGFPPV